MPSEQLSDNWRRTICRCAFLLLCILPTLITGYWIFHPQTASDWEKTIRAELGIATEIDSIETPGPNVTILRGVRFSDPVSGDLLNTTQIRVVRGRPNRIVIDYPTSMTCSALVKLVTKASENLVASNTNHHWQLEFNDDATIYSSIKSDYPPSIVTTGLTVNFGQYANGPAAELQFRLSDGPLNSVVGGYMQRRIGTPTEFGLHTGGNFLPCWLLEDLVPDLKKLGNETQFDGQVAISPWEYNPSQIDCEINGTFRGIELGELMDANDRHLAGDCTARVKGLLIRDRQIHSAAELTIGSSGGTVGAQLLTAAAINLGFVGSPIVTDHSDERFGFRNLELTCRLEQGQLVFSGGQGGVVAYNSAGEPWIGCDSSAVLTVDNLAHFLVQPGAEEERVTKDTMAFLNRFHRPAPSTDPSPILRTADQDEGSWAR